MKLRIVSDLHLELNNLFYIEPIKNKKIGKREEILVLAGDIFNKYSLDLVTLAKWSEMFLRVIIVMGNHEFYGADINYVDELRQILKKYKNIFLLENDTYSYKDVVFIGTTLWTDHKGGDPVVKHQLQQNINDYWKISGFKPETAMDLHEKSLTFLKNKLKKKDPKKKYIVITHHSPSFESTPEQFIGGINNYAFCSDLSELILDYKPDMWVHGHTHSSFDYKIGETRIICNPKGYGGENPNFNKNLIIEV